MTSSRRLKAQVETDVARITATTSLPPFLDKATQFVQFSDPATRTTEVSLPIAEVGRVLAALVDDTGLIGQYVPPAAANNFRASVLVTGANEANEAAYTNALGGALRTLMSGYLANTLSDADGAITSGQGLLSTIYSYRLTDLLESVPRRARIRVPGVRFSTGRLFDPETGEIVLSIHIDSTLLPSDDPRLEDYEVVFCSDALVQRRPAEFPAPLNSPPFMLGGSAVIASETEFGIPTVEARSFTAGSSALLGFANPGENPAINIFANQLATMLPGDVELFPGALRESFVSFNEPGSGGGHDTQKYFSFSEEGDVSGVTRVANRPCRTRRRPCCPPVRC